ncbi:MAG: dihydrofolate reductase [Actinomycetaceae bacterium]|nr:dihydrofolate reductase [Actinomycetaceae bacterium]
MIWAQDHKGLLGMNGQMAWHVPADFKHFKESTMGAPIIMGRTSWQALGGALPGRTNIVLTRQSGFEAPGAEVYATLEEALDACAGEEQVWITGGEQIYRLGMDIADELVITDLDLTVNTEGAHHLAYAPQVDPKRWHLDKERSDIEWRPVSGDAAWKVRYLIRAGD